MTSQFVSSSSRAFGRFFVSKYFSLYRLSCH